MNIKEHIEAGHYPKDNEGRSIITSDDGITYIVLTTKGHSKTCPIITMAEHVGSVDTWDIYGKNNASRVSSTREKLNEPKFVEITYHFWIVLYKGQQFSVCDTQEEAQTKIAVTECGTNRHEYAVMRVTGTHVQYK